MLPPSLPLISPRRRPGAAARVAGGLLAAGGLLLGGCGEGAATADPGATPPRRATGAATPEPVDMAFGVIPHGAVRVAEASIPLPQDLDVDLVPLAFQTTCSCARHRYIVERAGGARETFPGDGRVIPESTLRAGDRLLLELTLVTAEKPCADLAESDYAGQVVLQEENGRQRWFVPVRYSYGIEAPFELRPFPRLDFGDVPRPISFTLPVEIHTGDAGAVEFGEPRFVENASGTDPREPDDLQLTLTPPDAPGEPHLLEATFRATGDRPMGPFSIDVLLPTDRADEYVLRIPATGRVVPALRVAPPERFSFGQLDFNSPAERSLIVTDHHPERPPDFTVLAIRDANGGKLDEHFAVDLLPVEGQPRTRQVRLRYLGTLPEDRRSFRGVVELGKEAGEAPLVSLDFVGFRRLSRDG